jgi:preprotein translocase subunit SecD
MNRYPLWKYILIVIALLFGALYTVPNFFGEAPAVQISSAKSTVKIDSDMMARVEQVLQQGAIKAEGLTYENNGIQGTVRARFADIDTQFKAKALLNKRVAGLQSSVRSLLRDKEVRHAGISRDGDVITVKFRDAETRLKARNVLSDQMKDVSLLDAGATADNADLSLQIGIKPEALKELVSEGVKQNMTALHKRVNATGVSEPIIQQQGADRIVVQLPGVQDVAETKKIIGRTATLEVRMVDESVIGPVDENTAVPFGSEMFKVGRGGPAILYKEPVLTGDYISGASVSFDQNQQPAVSIDLNGDGGRKMREATRGKIGKSMAIVLFEKGKGDVLKGELLTVATIQAELGSSFQITGMGSSSASAELALLLRAGALAAPMVIIEERTIGSQLGEENINQGKNSVMYGFAAIAVFMTMYYMLFGFFSVLALGVNLLLLVGILSLLQATLTLPGMAAIALALGMAIDANVLINERIREELRGGAAPQAALTAGFDRAWATILDSNVTTFIVGLALLVFGSGPIKAFAIVHCLGILTSMFSAVFVSRGVVNLWYGRKKKLTSISIGQIWKPDADASTTATAMATTVTTTKSAE